MKENILLKVMQDYANREFRELAKIEILRLSKMYGNALVRSEIYKFFRNPPFILTKDNKVVFL